MARSSPGKMYLHTTHLLRNTSSGFSGRLGRRVPAGPAGVCRLWCSHHTGRLALYDRCAMPQAHAALSGAKMSRPCSCRHCMQQGHTCCWPGWQSAACHPSPRQAAGCLMQRLHALLRRHRVSSAHQPTARNEACDRLCHSSIFRVTEAPAASAEAANWLRQKEAMQMPVLRRGVEGRCRVLLLLQVD